ncbi:two-component system sensor histidine kinase NtrB [Desulfomonile tiedjei]|uniref:histidine kinase n=1 Tax=Desulfomonile tiedjei (strain ATCC 49306 / DSM 6799 / DCB-1) TaxID=706587 RepID=I4C9J3_DESTA|nr:ATP-binding protein [Desulfomonile tiedjei]AFM26234.1 signal transduction histidine kinase [Desulfomonile tiedjei DSM 6799]
MIPDTTAAGIGGGPFRLVKYFIFSGFVVIAIVTALMGAFLYSKSVETLLRSADSYARLVSENLNYNIYVGFYAPLKSRGIPVDLRKWDQFGALDSLIKDFTYGLKIQRIKIIDRQRKIIYSSEYDLIGKEEPRNNALESALGGKDVTHIRQDSNPEARWYGQRMTETYYPLREVTGNYWMLGNIYGVIQITQDVTDQYTSVQRSIVAIIVVAVGLMAFLFIALILIVRRGERILLLRAREQKHLEEQLQQSEKLASIGQMVATIAHEIRNPLGIVKSSAEMLVKKTNPDPARVRKLSGVIVEEATRLSNILTDFLDFARPRSPELKPIDVRDAISRVRDNLIQETDARRITWKDNDLNGLVPIVMGDRDLLYQAFLNMAINAFEAMQSDGVFAVTVTPENGTIRIDFSDTGQGIKPEDIPRIFTPFFTTHEMGTGLGLSVVHNIIAAHNGEITVSSREGEGTVFSVFLPAGGAD